MTSPIWTVGALQVGVYISAFLFGITTLQAHTYMGRFPKDKLLIKLMVGLVWLLELVHTVSVSQGLFCMVLSQYTKPQPSYDQGIDPGFRVAVLFSGIIAALVQAYFTHRLRVLSGKNMLAIVFWVFALLRFVGWTWASVVGIVQSLQRQADDQVDSVWAWPFLPLLAFGACVDLAIAAAVCYYFHASKGVGESTARLVDKLMFWTIQNGLIPGIAGLATSICLHTMRHNFVWVAVFMILTRLFSNSFLASLNARRKLRKLQSHSLFLMGEQREKSRQDLRLPDGPHARRASESTINLSTTHA